MGPSNLGYKPFSIHLAENKAVDSCIHVKCIPKFSFLQVFVVIAGF